MNKLKRTMRYFLGLVLAVTVLLGTGAFSAVNAAGTVSDGIDKVYLGGNTFGVKLFTEGLTVVGFDDIDCIGSSKSPAKDAGIEVNDVIIKVNDHTISTAEDFKKIIEGSEGKAVRLVYLRNNYKQSCELIPSVSSTDGKYKTGMWLRDSTAGIGTVTFIVPESGIFAGLGHGICDSNTGTLIALSRGVTSGVSINNIKKGTPGTPGELQGSFKGEKTGTLLENTDNGVFGIFIDPEINGHSEIEIGSDRDIKDGAAEIICTLDGAKPCRYSVKLSEIHRTDTGNKNFIVTVTDTELIEKTGGIVQGMSGSPIVQDGKLVGAVTHVFVNDPTRGYGILIKNMLSHIPTDCNKVVR